MYVTLFVVALIAVIMFHEFGHFATAKAFGMKVEKFFLGFGPTLWSIRRGETEYGVKAIPAGGFVKIVGMNKYEDVDPADADRTFYSKPAWQRAIVLVAGSFTHFVVAAVALFVALAFIGLPFLSNAVGEVAPGTPAERAGLLEGDRIVGVDGVAVEDFDAVRDLVTSRGGQTVDLRLIRDGAEQVVPVEIAAETPDGAEQGFLGIYPQPEEKRLGIGAALAGTVSGDFSLPRLTALTVDGLLQVFSPEGLGRFFSSVGDEGPRDLESPTSLVGIGQAVNAFGNAGDLFAVIVVLAQLSIVLGVLNMLPLPPLDGGHVAVLAVEEGVNAVRARRGRSQGEAPDEGRERWTVDPSVLTPIALAVILFFVVLSFTALYLDLTKPITDALQ